MKSYFDKSGQEDQTLMTISGIAANDDVWAEIEQDWLHILRSHDPRADYMHMVEAVNLRKEFARDKGWDDDKVFGLVNLLLSYLTDLPRDGRYCHFGCTLKMDDYKKLQTEGYQMDAPAHLLANACVSRIRQWYFFDYKGLDLEAHYFFDMGEPFEPIIKLQWEKERNASSYNQWSHIASIGSSAMRKTPGLQVADMFAWATNRHEVQISQRYCNLVTALRALVPSSWTIIDEAQLRGKFRSLNCHTYEEY